MVFCNLLSVNGNTALYAIGGNPNDLTGQLIINSEDGSYIILRAPENSKVYDTHIRSMIGKYRKSIDNGDFKEKMAYQIG